MSSLFARATAIIPIVATATLAAKEGYFYKLDSSNQAVAIAAVTDIPDGLIGAVTEDGLEISAFKQSGNHGPVRVKLGTAVTDLRLDLQLRADGTAGPDAGTGARVIVARPLETGDVDEVIEAVLITPKKYVLDSSGGTASNTLAAMTVTTPADLAAVAAQLVIIRNAIASLAAR